MIKSILCFLFLSIATAVSFGAPQLQQGSIVNAASFSVAGTPNSAIAQGSLFTVFGVAVGPTTAVNANQFPLPTTLGGVSIRVTAGGQNFDCPVLFAVNSQVSAILPSGVPAGSASLVLTYNAEASNSITFTVAERTPGVFSLTSTGSGQTVVQNYISPASQPINGIGQSAKPGQVAILWATGLGKSLNADDRNAPAPGNLLPLDQIKMYVGGKAATVEYAGRSGCCSGVDQINFVVPAGVKSCFAPVAVVINGVVSNFTSMSVDDNGGVCDGAYGLSEGDVETLLSKQNIRAGVVTLSRNRVEVLGFSVLSDTGFASFNEFSQGGFTGAGSSVGDAALAADSCIVTSYRFDTTQDGDIPEPPSVADIFRIKELDAGPSINVSGPQGQRQLLKQSNSTGNYFATLNNPANPLDSYLTAGNYTVNNANGGVDVGAFSFNRNVPSVFTWTNKAAISNIARSQPLTITWQPGASPSGVVIITAFSFSVPKKVASSLFCYARPETGTFTIPSYVLSGMVESDSAGQVLVPAGNLSFGTVADPGTFTAPGLDLGLFSTTSLENKTVAFQ